MQDLQNMVSVLKSPVSSTLSPQQKHWTKFMAASQSHPSEDLAEASISQLWVASQ